MKSVIIKCIEQNGSKTLRHVSPAMVRCKRIVTKITGAEAAPNNFADIDDTGQFPLFGNDPVAEVSFSAGPFQVCIELCGSARCRRPLSMENPAFSRCTQEFFLPPPGRFFEEMGDVPAAIIFQVCFSESHNGRRTISSDRYPVERQSFRPEPWVGCCWQHDIRASWEGRCH